MDPLFGIPVGLALSAAAGLRVFVPLLLTGVAARLGYFTLAPGMAWIGSDVALVAFATAMVLEVGAYYVPWLDNLLDSIATPDLSPFLRWALAIVAGGGAAGLVQTGTALLRLKSSTFTAGAGNPLIATGELAGSVVLSLVGLLVPLLAIVVVAVLLLLVASRLARLVRHRRGARPA